MRKRKFEERYNNNLEKSSPNDIHKDNESDSKKSNSKNNCTYNIFEEGEEETKKSFPINSEKMKNELENKNNQSSNIDVKEKIIQNKNSKERENNINDKKVQNGYEPNPNKNNIKETPPKIYNFISLISFIFELFNYSNIKENKKLD